MMYDGYILGELKTFFSSAVPEQVLSITVKKLSVVVHAVVAADFEGNNRRTLCVEYDSEFLQVDLRDDAKTKGKTFATIIKGKCLYLCLQKG